MLPTVLLQQLGCRTPEVATQLQDEEYVKAGATIASKQDAFSQDITLKLRPPDINSEVPAFRDGTRQACGESLACRTCLVSAVTVAERLSVCCSTEQLTVFVGLPAASSHTFTQHETGNCLRRCSRSG